MIRGLPPKQWESLFKSADFWDGMPDPGVLEPEMLVAITAKDVASRRVAAKLLGQSGGTPAALHALVGALADTDAIVVTRALDSLESLDPGEVARHLARLMAHADASVRACACETAGKARFSIDANGPPVTAGDPRLHGSLDALVTCLGDRDADVRAEAACALSHFGDEARAAIPALTKLLDARQQAVQIQAARALVAIGPPLDLLDRILRDHNLCLTPFASQRDPFQSALRGGGEHGGHG